MARPSSAQFDAIVHDFLDALDKIEKEKSDDCYSIEKDNPTRSDERIDEVLEEARERILEESGRLCQKLNHLNLKPQWRQPPSLTWEAWGLVWICAEGCGRIVGPDQHLRHLTLHPNHHPQVSASKATANGLPTIDDVRRPLCLRPQVRAIYLARFQSLTEKVQDGTATSNEEKEFFALRREFIG
jgi:hypothetical protein